LIYVSRGTLFAVPFNLEKLEVRGTPIPVLEEVGYSAQFGFAQFDFAQFDFARNGTLMYRNGRGGSELATVQWLDGAGKTQPLLAKPGNYLHPRLSPDGQRLGLLVADGCLFLERIGELYGRFARGGNHRGHDSNVCDGKNQRNQPQGMLRG
jgi:eukaryotic-like serine/threonine-protein kinase